MGSLYFFSGFFIFKDKNISPIKIEGSFDTLSKQCLSDESNPFNFLNIMFRNKDLLTCKVSSNDEKYKQVKSLNFIYDKENSSYLARVFSENELNRSQASRDQSFTKDEIGIIVIQILNRDLSYYNNTNERLIFLQESKKNREPVS